MQIWNTIKYWTRNKTNTIVVGCFSVETLRRKVSFEKVEGSSSEAIGVVCIVILSLLLALIVVLDIHKLRKSIIQSRRRRRQRASGNRSNIGLQRTCF